jgi:prolyl oligopeptidase
MTNTEKIACDPYRWMEEDTPDLRAWVTAQHEYTMAQLSSLPAREGIRRRLEELLRTHLIRVS